MQAADRPPGRSGRRAGLAAATLAIVCLAPPFPVSAQNPSRLTPTLSGELTYTDNVDLNSRESQQGDWVLRLTPGFVVDWRGPRTELVGSVSLPILLYARTGESNNQVLPLANLLGRAEVVENFFFVDASATVVQSYFNPFGARPDSLTNATENRYQTETYRVSPRIQGFITNQIRYSLRNDNVWSNPSDAPDVVQSSYTNRLVGNIEREPTPLGWGVDLIRDQFEYSDDDASNQRLDLARLRLVYQPDPQFQATASGGYEINHYPLRTIENAIYGVGFRWRPTERTSLDVRWEHRYFGGSYDVAFNHRTPMTVWSVQATRNVTSYPLELAELPTGAIVPLFLNELLRSRVPDPVERARLVTDFIRNQGLPIVLADPVTIFSQQQYLQELASASAGFLGVRNSVLFTLYRNRTQSITAEGELLPPQLAGFVDNTQLGAGATWSYRLTPTATLTLTGSHSRTESDVGAELGSKQSSVRLTLTRPISPDTSAYAGMRWQKQDPDLGDGYREAAVFVGVFHTFR